MAEIPSLSEITNISADPERASGNGPFVIDNRELIRNLTQASLYKAENDKWKYNTFLNEVNNVYKDIGNLAEMDVATQDLPELKKQFADTLNEVYKDPREFFSGVGNQKRINLQQKLAELRKNSIESRQNRLYDMAHRDYIARNPDLNNDENKAKIEAFWKQPLGKRTPYTLDIDTPVDLMGLAKSINEQVKTPYAKTGFSPDGRYIVDEKGTTYDPKRFMNIASNAYDLPNKQGQLMRSGVEKLFAKLDPSMQKQYENDPRKFYLQNMQSLIRQNEVADTGLKADPYGLEILENKNRRGLEFLKSSLEQQGSPEQSDFLIKTVQSLYNNKTGRTLAIDISKGKEASRYVTEEAINTTPELMRIYSKPVKRTRRTTDILGEESVTESESLLPPDALTVTADGNIRRVFYERDDNGNIKNNSAGKPIVDNQDVVPIRETLGLIGKNFIDKKSLPAALNRAGKQIEDMGGHVLGKSAIAQRANPSPQTYQYKGKSYTEEQIKAAADASGVSVEEYKKAIGL